MTDLIQEVKTEVEEAKTEVEVEVEVEVARAEFDALVARVEAIEKVVESRAQKIVAAFKHLGHDVRSLF